jgi:hypothetical protein
MVPAANGLVTGSGSSVGVPASELVDAMGRSAAVAGHRESERVAGLLTALDKVYRIRAGDWPWPPDTNQDERDRVSAAATTEALRLLAEYSDGLRKRIR